MTLDTENTSACFLILDLCRCVCVCVCARAGQEKKDDKWQKGQTSPVRDEATGNKYNTFNIIFKERAHLRRAPNL